MDIIKKNVYDLSNIDLSKHEIKNSVSNKAIITAVHNKFFIIFKEKRD